MCIGRQVKGQGLRPQASGMGCRMQYETRRMQKPCPRIGEGVGTCCAHALARSQVEGEKAGADARADGAKEFCAVSLPTAAVSSVASEAGSSVTVGISDRIERKGGSVT